MSEFKRGAIIAPLSPFASRFAEISLKSLAPPPDRYDPDELTPVQMSPFANDRSGDCVLAARANHTLRLLNQPGMRISDSEVLNEYHKEASSYWFFGRHYLGVNTETSIQLWRDRGWTCGGAPNHRIAEYHSVDYKDQEELRAAIFSLQGVQFALSLPKGLSNSNQCGPGHPWNMTNLPKGNGHTLLLRGYDEVGPIGVTWGVTQNMSWDFVRTYGELAFAVSGAT